MDGSVSLSEAQRKRLLVMLRTHRDARVCRRAQIILWLADGWSWSEVQGGLYCSRRTIARWKERFEQGGVDALVEERRGRPSPFGPWLVVRVVTWVTTKWPRDFGFLRSRWTCECLAILIFQFASVRVSRETVRRWLHRENLVWRRPRPVVGPQDPQRAVVLRKLRHLLKDMPNDEIAVFQDEVDVNTNPKIGSMWMKKGEQAEVITPGNNEKRYLAGSLNWRTGELIVTEGGKGEGRNSQLFIRHLEEVRTRLRCYRKIHVICDNATSTTARPCVSTCPNMATGS